MAEENKKGVRRIVKASPTERANTKKALSGSVEESFNDIKVTIANEAMTLKDRSFRRGLDLKETRVLTQLADVLIKLNKEEREAVKEANYEDKSEEDLIKELKDMLKKDDGNGNS